MEQLPQVLQQAWPQIVNFFAIVGILRVINKPIFSLLHAFTHFTKTKKDDKIFTKIVRSRTYKFFCFLLDWFASVKLVK